MELLKDVRVVDFSAATAGPFCSMALGDMGADVIKVEPPTGDHSRELGRWRVDGKSVTYMSVNRNKRSVVIDLTTEAGRAAAHALIADCDIVLESFAPGGAEKFEIDYETCRSLNDRVIYCSVSGFGRTGPRRGELGTDTMLQAYSGIMSFTGEPDRPPIRIPVASIDLMTGAMGIAGIMAALYERRDSGVGQRVEVSLFDTAVSLLHAAIPQYTATGALPQKWGSEWPYAVPNGVFETSDGYCFLAVATSAHWERFCAALDLADLLHDPRFDTNALRVENRKELRDILRPIFGGYTADELEARLKKARVPASKIRTVAETIEDEHARERDSIRALPGYPGIRVANLPLKLERGFRSAWLDPPDLGNANAEVFGPQKPDPPAGSEES
jgi:crotonobetainyl-CoA:carnitine CoA-transferase CaiB-like acyl-CoA transferase